jgi:hypothetical protein
MESWNKTDTELLIKLYINDKLELLEICRIMKRKCKVIIAKLIELGVVKTKYEIRGNNNTISQVQKQDTKTTNPIIQQSKIQSITQAQNDTIELIQNVNKIITQASIICSNYSKLVSSIKSIYNSDELKEL